MGLQDAVAASEIRSIFFHIRCPNELFHVGKVPQSSHLLLVLNQVRLRNKRNTQSLHFCLHTISPHLVEAHLPDGRENINVVLLGPEPHIFVIVQ